jgi:hypothetical protein
MNTEDLLKLTFEEQKEWVLKSTSVSDDDPFCYIIELDEYRLNEMLEDPEEYGIADDIRHAGLDLTEKRENEIYSGDSLKSEELRLLKDVLMEQQGEDPYEGDNYMARAITCSNGQVVAIFKGRAAGHSVDWTFDCLCGSKDEYVADLRNKLSENEQLFFL